MTIKEFKLISKESNGTFPMLETIAEHEVIYDEMYLYNHHDNYELEYMFFGDTLNLQDNYVEYFYVMSYDEVGEVIGVLKISSGSRGETALPFDTLFTYLLLTGSYSFITIHNHPNNNPEKSSADKNCDASIKHVADILGLEFRGGLTITKQQMRDLHEKMYEFEREVLGDDACESLEEYVDLLNP